MEGPRKKTVIIVGVPGVGKSTIISNATTTLQKKGTTLNTVVFGSVMFEEAKKLGINDRDQIRKQTIDVQQRLQNMTADHISSLNDSIVVVDTHLFIKTQSGYYPGLPMNLILKLNPERLILITANSEEILNRRKNDSTRTRDLISEDEIKRDIEVSLSMISSLSILTGAPFEIIYNHDNMIDSATSLLVELLKKST
ncbi:MAG: adenylate kinase [Nitrososphaeraceae archaeon]|nr:adenylate kinase [Nitrososphaeraceae archaeon]MDW0136942.1 adenylate kinase [Nitrososphaeraceae archaeon]MDW0143095.1 adenylate kinase [Nitrososphaeraceae archaeon]MDW0146443.1 adenylate kinase [Nitrososphaeraceae archaeon]MDW0148086.1 adenylate kinase [Nitrososphaeraceae archaeon]